MPTNRPYVLSIAGFDPSGGAGVLADAKTFNQIGVHGLAINTAITLQTEDKFVDVVWQPLEYIQKNIELLFGRYQIDFCKIGLVENEFVLLQIVDLLIAKNETIKIIWDPIFKASTGFDFHHFTSNATIEKLLGKIWMITPNLNEIQNNLFHELQSKYPYYMVLKGGHAADGLFVDQLYLNGKVIKNVEGKPLKLPAKHGSGCVYSSALIAYLAKGDDLEEAVVSAKNYIENYLLSDKTLLGIHA